MKASRYVWLSMLVVFTCSPALYAQEATESDWTAPSYEEVEKDYTPFPNPDAGYVTDIANVLTLREEERIERWLWETESRTGVEIIVVIIDSIRRYPGTPNSSIETFATGLFDAYGIGNMPENNGVLLLVAISDRKARIELGAGYGRARDGDARRIMANEIIPYFKKEDYAGGVTSGVQAIMLEFAGVHAGINWPLVGIVVAIPAVGMIAYSLFKNGKKGWGWVCVGFLIVLILVLLWLLRGIVTNAPRGRSGGWSSGGLGGFGGGFSGGGGATGSW